MSNNFSQIKNNALGQLLSGIGSQPCSVEISGYENFPEGTFYCVIWKDSESPLNANSKEIVLANRQVNSSIVSLISRDIDNTGPHSWPPGSFIANVITSQKIEEIEDHVGSIDVSDISPSTDKDGKLWLEKNTMILRCSKDGLWHLMSFGHHTHLKSEIVDFEHTHDKAQIVDFVHSHTWVERGGPDYTNQGGKYLRVKTDGSGLEWWEIPQPGFEYEIQFSFSDQGKNPVIVIITQQQYQVWILYLDSNNILKVSKYDGQDWTDPVVVGRATNFDSGYKNGRINVVLTYNGNVYFRTWPIEYTPTQIVYPDEIPQKFNFSNIDLFPQGEFVTRSIPDVEPPQNLNWQPTQLTWQQSPRPQGLVVGYNIYKEEGQIIEKINNQPITSTNFELLEPVRFAKYYATCIVTPWYGQKFKESRFSTPYQLTSLLISKLAQSTYKNSDLSKIEITRQFNSVIAIRQDETEFGQSDQYYMNITRQFNPLLSMIDQQKQYKQSEFIQEVITKSYGYSQH